MINRIASIDGLRAIAVIAVLIFHVDRMVLPGGYLGVDFFFVISGFVVSKSLLENRLRFSAFLLRRFYRLAPAAAVTIIATIAMFNFTGNGLLSREHISSALAALFAVSNIYFMMHSSYFDTALQGNPLLHFWSLSVEEQFYLVWPWILALIAPWPIVKKLASVIFLASLSVLLHSSSATQEFFLMPARAYQFGCGALVYIGIVQRRVNFRPMLLYPSLAASIALFCINDGTQGWLNGGLLPTIVFSVLIGSAAALPRSIILTNSPMQLLGRASYSIYLVHWPIIVFSRIMFPEGAAIDIALFSISILIGVGLYYTIEKPFNYRDLPDRPEILVQRTGIGRFGAPVLSLLAAITLASVILSGHSTADDTLTPTQIAKTKHPGHSKVDALLTATAAKRKEADRKLWRCNTYEHGRLNGQIEYKILAELDLDDCLRGKEMIIVDSTGEVAVRFIAAISNSSDYAILSSSGCSFSTKIGSNDCGRMNTLRMRILSKEKCDYSTVFIGNNWGKFTSEQVASLMEFLSKSNCHIRLLSPLPYFSVSPYQLVSANGGHSVDLASRIDPAVWERRRAIYEHIATSTHIDVLDWSVLDEPGAPVPALTDEGRAIYRDNYHYTNEGKTWLIGRYLAIRQGS